MGFFTWLAARRIKKERQQSTPFALALADSLISKPQDWSYNSDEKWIKNEKADVQMSAPQRRCTTLNVHRLYGNCNSSVVIAEYEYTADRYVIDRAYLGWKEATALERERDRETAKARIVIALAA